MRCPSCQNENDAGAAYCDMCGMDLNPSRPAPSGGSAPVPAPPQPANPHQKRHTVFEPGPAAAAPPPPAAAPAPPRGGADFFAQPPPPRPTFDPRDPFAAASLPPTRASVSPPIPHASSTAASARPKAQTIVGSVGGAQEAPSAGMVRGALFEYRGPTDTGRVHPLRVGRNVLGRNADCDVVLEDGRVSGQHAYVFIRAEDASFIDVSSNGSVVNGSVVHGEQLVLQNHAVITLGGTTLVLVIVPEVLLSRRSS